MAQPTVRRHHLESGTLLGEQVAGTSSSLPHCLSPGGSGCPTA